MTEEKKIDPTLEIAIKHFEELLNKQTAPDLPEELSDIKRIKDVHESMVKLRGVLSDFSRGDLSHTVAFRGFAAGCLKALQAHLRHMVWQVQQVAEGDFTQQVEFLGDFSTAFNSMVHQLDSVMTALRQKEEDLLKLTRNLQQEVELRKSAMNALSQSEAKYRYLAERDPLTDCYNRRYFFSNAVAALKNSTISGEPCCFALMDLDKFKTLNDTYGHAAGDAALKHAVKVADSCLRNNDLMGRYGGEEFIFYFSSANLEQGIIAADRIREAIAESPLVYPLTGQTISMTVSIGVGVVLPEWPGKRTEDYMLQIINAADAAMYEAKQKGRNMTLAAPEEPPTDVIQIDR